MKKISIVLIEDEPVVQRNLSAYLNAHPDVEVIGIFGRVEDWRDAHEHDPSLRPGILLLDINLAGRHRTDPPAATGLRYHHADHF